MNGESNQEHDIQKDLWVAIESLLKPEAGVSANSSDRLSTPVSLRVSQDRVHEAIFLGGRRGEGKTTVLLQVLRRIEKGENPEYRSLGLLDPTLLETKQNIILSVVQRIREYLICEDTGWTPRSKEREAKFQAAEDSLRELAKGISVLDGVGNDLHDEDWSNASFILDEGMDRAKAAYGFEQRFRDFVSCAADALECEAFVLCVDDVDTKSEMGGPVLEALRKYLTSPKLRVIVSGDPELLQTLTRKLQIHSLGRELVDFELKISGSHSSQSRIGQVLEQLNQLEDQFLTKVLPPKRRMKLKTLNEIAATGKIMLRWQYKKPDEIFPLDVVIADILERHLGQKSKDVVERYRSAIFTMPIRSIIEFLDVWDKPSGNPNDFEVAQRIVEVARTQLLARGLRVDAVLSIPDSSKQLRRIVEWLCDNPDNWSSLSSLVPHGVDEDTDRAILGLASMVSLDRLERPADIFQFWLLFDLLKNQVALGAFNGRGSRKDTLRRFLAHVRYSQDEPLRQFIGYWSGWERSSSNRAVSGITSEPSLFGIPVATDRVRNANTALQTMYGLEYNNGKNWNKFRVDAQDGRHAFIESLPQDIRTFHRKISQDSSPYGKNQNTLAGALYNSIEGLAGRVDQTAASVLLLPYTRITSAQKYAHGNYSLLQLLAGLPEIGKGAKSLQAMTQWQSIDTFPSRSLDPMDMEIVPRKNINSDEGIHNEDLGAERDEGYSDEVIQKTGFNKQFLEDLDQWSKGQIAYGKVAATALMAAWKKFTDAVPRIFERKISAKTNPGNQSIFLGRFMHRKIFVFLHALGVELFLHEGGELGPRVQSSPTNSDEFFFDLLQILGSQKVRTETIYGTSERDFETTPGGELFYRVLRCPLWAYFLEPRAFRRMCSEIDVEPTELPVVDYAPPGSSSDLVKFEGLYHLLNTVAMPEVGDE